VVLDEQGKAQFPLLQNRGRSRDGVLADLPFVRLSEHIPHNGRAFFAAAERQRIEGIVAKLADSRYISGERSRAWLKIKAELRQHTVIGGYTIERGSRARLGALLLGVYVEGELAYIGHTGTGFNGQALLDVRKRLEPLLQEACPFKRRPKANAQGGG
jgi:bifunctional non-homologous end joining protein LigD